MIIKILAPQVIARIAAGEVVERPASVVKELVENSLDAGATQITVESRSGGINMLRVTDNGVGITSTELELTCQRHATSKIASLNDLESISTLGFRGEALASIAAVAQVDIVSRTADESVASKLTVSDGVVTARGTQAHSQGTTVTVRNLFRNVPARLKFLKSPSTENSRIAGVVSQYALAFPEVRFSLTIDDRTILKTPGSSRLLDSIIEVYGLEIARNMLEIKKDSVWEGGMPNLIMVTGMVGAPTIGRATREYISFFVNRRWVSGRLLIYAVEEAYHGLLMTGKHPVAIINITLPMQDVDVNIHPAKTEIKFQNERAVFGAVQRAIRQVLVAQAPVPMIEEVTPTYTGTPPQRSQALLTLVQQMERPGSLPSAVQPTPSLSLPALRVLGQLASNYIVAEGPDGLYLIDQHAAHERVVFEKVKQQHTEHGVKVQGLLEPFTLEVNPRQDEVLKSHYPELADFGFLIEPFGNRTYLIRTVPAWLYKKDWLGAVRELLDSGEDRGDWRDRVAISIACHSAIRAGQALTDDEMRSLIRQLEQTSLPHTCPHGRPTVLHLSRGQLEKEFGRS
jgi:DNA mismatch repair protein MutL